MAETGNEICRLSQFSIVCDNIKILILRPKGSVDIYVIARQTHSTVFLCTAMLFIFKHLF